MWATLPVLRIRLNTMMRYIYIYKCMCQYEIILYDYINVHTIYLAMHFHKMDRGGLNKEIRAIHLISICIYIHIYVYIC